MEKHHKYRIIIGGGGTGGHVFPAISIAHALTEQNRKTEILFVGARNRLEMEKVPEAGYEIIGLPVAGFQRRLTWKNLLFFVRLIRSMIESRRIIRRFAPDAVVGVGGYASGPILRAAARKGIPVLIQEQNSYAGVTNRILARSARRICVAYEGMENYFPSEKLILTGNPVRKDLIAKPGKRESNMAHFGLQPDKKTIMILGGSQGARTINESVVGYLDRLSNSEVQLLWQAGKLYYESIREQVERGVAANIKVVPFIREMNRAYQVADVIVSRAGAGTLSELCIVGKPVVLVPSPNVAEDHQTRNARSLTDADAALMVPDREARDTLMETVLALVRDGEKCSRLAANIKKFALPDAAANIAREVFQMIEKS